MKECTKYAGVLFRIWFRILPRRIPRIVTCFLCLPPIPSKSGFLLKSCVLAADRRGYSVTRERMKILAIIGVISLFVSLNYASPLGREKRDGDSDDDHRHDDREPERKYGEDSCYRRRF